MKVNFLFNTLFSPRNVEASFEQPKLEPKHQSPVLQDVIGFVPILYIPLLHYVPITDPQYNFYYTFIGGRSRVLLCKWDRRHYNVCSVSEGAGRLGGGRLSFVSTSHVE